MHIFTDLILFAAAGLQFFLAFLVLRKTNRSKRDISLIIVLILIGIWVFTNILIDRASTNDQAENLGKLTAMVNSFLPLVLLYFVAVVSRIKMNKKYVIFVLPSIVFFYLSFTDFIVSGADITVFPVVIHHGSEFIYYVSYVALYYLFVLIVLLRGIGRSERVVKSQLFYLLIGAALMVTISLVTNVALPLLNVSTEFTRIGPSSTLFFSLFTTYAIVRYKFLDIRILLTRSIIYGVLILFVTGSFVLASLLISQLITSESGTGQLVSSAVVAFLVVALLDPLKNLIASVTNSIFFKEAIDYPKVTKRLTDIINEEIELDKLVTRFIEHLEKELSVNQAILLLSVGNEAFWLPDELNTHKKDTNALNITGFFKHSPVVDTLQREREIILLDEIDRRITSAKDDHHREQAVALRTELENIGAQAVVPIFVKRELVAILLLSLKLSGDTYSSQDIHLLEVISPQMGSGVQKARLYQQEKEFAVKLKQEVDRATADLKEANRKLTELDNAKSEFMSIASHQLRTPLAGVMGYLSMIMEGDYGEINKEQEPILKDVLEATKRLIRMVNIFLNATRIEAGRFVMNFTKVNFADSIEAIYKELKPTADKKEVKLVHERTELGEAEVDADKIKDVILNLVDNAIKYSPGGEVRISSELINDGRHIHVMVQDTGVGIPPEEAKNLFSKFIRGSGIAQVEPDGSGLGLFIAKKIVEGHSGRIWAESDGLEKGSTFQFIIPTQADQRAKQKAEEFRNRAKVGNDSEEESEEEPTEEATQEEPAQEEENA